MQRPDKRPRAIRPWRRGGAVAFWLLALALPVAAPLPGRAEPAAVDAAQPQAELKAVEDSIRKAEERRAALEAETTALAAERADVQRRAVKAAARIQTAEDAVTAAGARINDLTKTTKARAADLNARQAQLSVSLAALQRLARQPPAATLLREGKPVDVLRGGLLLGAAVPQLSAETRRLVQELAELQQLHIRMDDERAHLLAARDELLASRTELALLLARRRTAEENSRASLEDEQQRLAALTDNARDLKDLIAAAEEARRQREAAARRAAERAATAAAEASGPDASRKRSEAARLKAALMAPPRGNKGSGKTDDASVLPVRGQMMTVFGAADPEGLTSRGVRIATAAAAEVVSPVAGQIVFSGPFKGYGQLLIVAAGGGYHLLLAGMDRIDGTIGQRVLAGEPVGRMGDGESDAPVLYIELRRDGEPVDPLPWIGAGQDRTGDGGRAGGGPG